MDTEKYFVRKIGMFKDLDELLAVVRKEATSKFLVKSTHAYCENAL